MPKFVTEVINTITEQLKSYQEQKETIIAIHRRSWTQIQVEINTQITHLQALDEGVNPLRKQLKGNAEYSLLRSTLFKKLAKLQTRLDAIKNLANTQPFTSRKERQIYKELLEQATSDLEKNSVDVFQQLSQHMSDLLHCFANVLLARMENKESFSLPIHELRVAALIDAMGLGTQSVEQPSSELIEKLKFIIASKNSPKPCRKQLVDILKKITDSPQNIPLILAALQETLKPVIEPAQTRADRIINQRLLTISPAACIATLNAELSDQFYLAKFPATFNSFISTNRNNQELSAEIESRLSALESHASQCKALQDLVSDCRNKLHGLQPETMTNPTLDDYFALTGKLNQLKNDIETGDFFKAVKIELVNYLSTIKCNLPLLEYCRTIQPNFEKLKKGSELDKQIIQQFFPSREKTLAQLKAWMTHINNYSKQTRLSQILTFDKIIGNEVNVIYLPMQSEVAEYRFVLTILKDTNTDEKNFILLDINNPHRTERIKKLTDKIFFMLKNENRLDQYRHLMKLQQFFKVEEDPQQRSSAFLLFKKEFRQAMTEKSLESLKNLYNTNASLGEICALFREFKNLDRIPLLATAEAKAWFDVTNNAINTFIQCTAEINNKQYKYTPTFFLTGGDSKQQSIVELKATLERLPLNTTQQELEKTFEKWENKYKSIIDIPRYRPILAQLMEIFHSMQTLFNGKVFATETRTLVNRLKEQAVKATSATSSMTSRTL